MSDLIGERILIPTITSSEQNWELKYPSQDASELPRLSATMVTPQDNGNARSICDESPHESTYTSIEPGGECRWTVGKVQAVHTRGCWNMLGIWKLRQEESLVWLWMWGNNQQKKRGVQTSTPNISDAELYGSVQKIKKRGETNSS